jgi:hypothetical protein
LYVTAFVQPTSGETFWYVSNGVSKPFFAALLALFAREAGAGRERIRNYPEFRVWAGMMGGKEPPHAKTQRTSYP